MIVTGMGSSGILAERPTGQSRKFTDPSAQYCSGTGRNVMRSSKRILVVFLVSMLVSASGQLASAQQKKGKAKKPPVADAATKAANDAKASEDKADGSKKTVAEANEAVHTAQKAVDEATKALKKIEDDTIDGQSADSDFGKARDVYRAADKKYQDARKTLLEDESFKDRLAKARELDDPQPALMALHKEFDETPAIADSRAALQTAKETYEPLKTKLLEGTPDWVTANDDYKAKKTALDSARHKFSAATSAAAKAKAAARRAEQAAAAAAQQAAQQPRQPNRGRRRY
jgi:hypothetical protein